MCLLRDSSAKAAVDRPMAMVVDSRVRMVFFVVNGDWGKCVGLPPDLL
jgi:hypothetical protein